jgi:general secretion pathway protein A
MDWRVFGLKETPFNVTPDPAYLHMTASHEGAFSQLVYGIGQRKGFLLITGEVGTGKTTLCRALMQQLDKSVHRALILGSSLDRDELVRLVAADYGITEEEGGYVAGLEDINRFLMERVEKGENAVLVIDEAQNLPDATLEELRLISNLETDTAKLVQIILVGQPELKEKLRQPHLRQLDQRIVVRYSLRSLTADETQEYIAHRVSVAALDKPPEIFTPAAVKAVHAASGGIPRLINALCDRSLFEAAQEGSPYADDNHVRTARKALDREPPVRRGSIAAAVTAVVTAAAVAFWLSSARNLAGHSPEKSLSPAPSPAAVPATGRNAAAVPSSAAGLPQRDDAGTYRTERSEESLNAALATLFSLWKMDYLAEEALRWRIMNISGRLLHTWFEEVKIAEQYGVSFRSLEADADAVLRLDLPFLYTVSSATGKRFAVVAAVGGGEAVVLDPLAGRRTEPLAGLVKGAVGELHILLRDPGGGKVLKEGNRGSRVMALQEKLAGTGFFAEDPDGTFGPKTRDAVKAFQRSRGLDVDGAAGLLTQLALDRARGFDIPSLKDNR